MELLINTDASCGQKMERERLSLTLKGMLTSPTLCNLKAVLINPFTFPLWAGPAQIQMLLTWVTLIPLLAWHPLIVSVPTKMRSLTPLCHSHWPWDITFPRPGKRHKARVSLRLLGLKGRLLWTGEFSAHECFIQLLYATTASQVSCTGRGNSGRAEEMQGMNVLDHVVSGENSVQILRCNFLWKLHSKIFSFTSLQLYFLCSWC